LKKNAGIKWTQTANDRKAWRKEEEAYIQRCMIRADDEKVRIRYKILPH